MKKQMKKQIEKVSIILVVIFIVLTGCKPASPAPDNQGTLKEPGTVQNRETTDTDIPEGTNMEEGEDEVQDILGALTLEEKVGQLFIPAFRYDKDNNPLHALDSNTKQILQKYRPGGIILFSQNIESIPQTVKLIDDMQQENKIPMFIAVDEEGGKISRLNSSEEMHATKLPGNDVLGRTNNPELAYKVGRLLGSELSSLGFNMDFAPVADVNTNPDNPVIGSRSFGSDPQKAADMVAAEVKGLQDENVCAVLKHFPGHGDTSSDTHTGAVIINHDIKRLESVEFIPFKSGIDAGVDCIMTAHIQAPLITGNNLPATLSSKFLTEILRKDLKFDGLIITDALEMGAISKYWAPDEAAVRAFLAGADLLLIPASLEEAYNGIVKAVKDGRISEDRLDISVKRILTIKKQRGILAKEKNGADPEDVLGSQEHQEIVKQILKEASME